MNAERGMRNAESVQALAEVLSIPMVRISVQGETRTLSIDEATALSNSLCRALATIDGKRGIAPILIAVSTEFGIDLAKLLGDSRQEKIARARQVAMYLTREITRLPQTFVGDLFGRDHGTVLHAERVIRDYMAVYPEWQQRIEGMKQSLGHLAEAGPDKLLALKRPSTNGDKEQRK